MPGHTETRNPISISAAPATRVIGQRYYDLAGTLELMRQLWARQVVDGFELQNLAEWDAAHPPRDEGERRLAAWEASQRYTTEELASLLRAAGMPILSVHANRDVGNCLCTGDERDLARGKALIHASLSLAEKLGAGVCVFHLWDTWAVEFDPAVLQGVLSGAASHYPAVRASVENVPTHLPDCTPFDLVQRFQWITLDLQWAAMFDELGRFEALRERIANVHLRGRLEGGAWVLDGAPVGFYEALRTIRSEWGYEGLLTVEPNALRPGEIENLAAAMASVAATR
jgi:hypothetical protein